MAHVKVGELYIKATTIHIIFAWSAALIQSFRLKEWRYKCKAAIAKRKKEIHELCAAHNRDMKRANDILMSDTISAENMDTLKLLTMRVLDGEIPDKS